MTTPAQTQEIIGWIGHNVIDRSGDKVGRVSQIYVDDKTGQPHWLAINTGLFGRRSSFVPTEGARTDGDNLAVPWSKSIIKDAPQVDDDGDGHLTIEEENELYSYYENRTKAGTDGKGGAEQRDKAMTRSEERVNVGTRTTETGRVRLRKYVVTEQVTRTVPVSQRGSAD